MHKVSRKTSGVIFHFKLCLLLPGRVKCSHTCVDDSNTYHIERQFNISFSLPYVAPSFTEELSAYICLDKRHLMEGSSIILPITIIKEITCPYVYIFGANVHLHLWIPDLLVSRFRHKHMQYSWIDLDLFWHNCHTFCCVCS